MRIDWKHIFTALALTGIVSSLGAYSDFQEVKKRVDEHESQLKVIGTVVCEYAIRDNLPNSTEKCVQMLRGNK